MSLGRSLELFFIDGRPDGMLTAEVFNWTGHVLRIPRTQIKQGLDRPESKHTGVYVLLGQIDGEATAYIGEAENMRVRIAQHVSGKDWWDEAILVSTTGDMLHKAHVKYLESRLVEIARSVGKMTLENSSTPARSSLTEAALANMESFLDTLNMVFPAIRVDMFLERSRPAKRQTPTVENPSQTFVLSSKKTGVSALAELQDGQWIVQAGSKARSSWVGTNPGNVSYRGLHAELVSNGTLQIVNELATFTKDFAFSAPSAAAAVLFGRAANGRTSWLTQDTNVTFAEWEEAQILKEPQE
jgi:hypothetical protein|tara:strand:+ start:3070 stop:3966 length:897 start_codon:yes stop_codon:yes gene_type:complete